jgi:predicted amidohydrolase
MASAAAATGAAASSPGILALCQIEPFHGDVAASAAKLIQVIAASRASAGKGAPLVVVVPEVYLHHYGAFDPRKDDSPAPVAWDSEAVSLIAAAATEYTAAVVVTAALSQTACGHAVKGRSFPVLPTRASRSAPESDGILLPFNAAVAIDADGSIVAVYGKTHLWNGGGWDHVERDLYQASCEAVRSAGWRLETTAQKDVGPCDTIPVDAVYPVFSLPAAGFGDLKFGMCICYDIEHASVADGYASRGADVILVPTASTGPSSILSHTLVRARAFENHVTVAYCNYPSRRAASGTGIGSGSATPAEGSAVPVRWAAVASGTPPAGSSAFGTGLEAVAPLGFSGESVVYGGDGELLGAAEPAGAECVTLVRLHARDDESLTKHKARNPYLADRRTDLAALVA